MCQDIETEMKSQPESQNKNNMKSPSTLFDVPSSAAPEESRLVKAIRTFIERVSLLGYYVSDSREIQYGKDRAGRLDEAGTELLSAIREVEEDTDSPKKSLPPPQVDAATVIINKISDEIQRDIKSLFDAVTDIPLTVNAEGEIKPLFEPQSFGYNSLQDWLKKFGTRQQWKDENRRRFLHPLAGPKIETIAQAEEILAKQGFPDVVKDVSGGNCLTVTEYPVRNIYLRSPVEGENRSDGFSKIEENQSYWVFNRGLVFKAIVVGRVDSKTFPDKDAVQLYIIPPTRTNASLIGLNIIAGDVETYYFTDEITATFFAARQLAVNS